MSDDYLRAWEASYPRRQPFAPQQQSAARLVDDAGKALPPAGSGFVKHDNGKPKFSLIPTRALLEVAKVFTAGALKYPKHNYLKGTDWTRYMDAGQRHDSSWLLGEDLDPESGLAALAHSIASRMIVLELQLRKLGTDDRVGSPIANCDL